MTKKADTSEAARMLARVGASKGGQARKNTLTAEERSEIARKAAAARWKKEKGAEYESPQEAVEVEVIPQDRDLPHSMFRGTLKLGEIDLEVHVLSDGKRAITQREVVRAISGGRESGNLTRYLDRNPLVDTEAIQGQVLRFRIPGSKAVAHGYEATLLVEICDSYLQARDAKKLDHSQLKLAIQAEMILRACAKVGIIALIDEATGYQEIRSKRALQLKLQAFIADEIQEWARMFPEEFWLELARLEGIRYSPRNRPLRWGRYVMMFVYDAIDEDVGRQLREVNPNPRFLRNHHQWLKKFGRDRVHNQIQQVIAVMKLCTDMDDFKTKFGRVFKNTPLQITFDDIDWQA